MKIIHRKKFSKNYIKLPRNLRQKVRTTEQLFKREPFHPSLQNHTLHGQLKHLRSISVTNDVRIIFEEFDNYAIVLMLDVGSHNRVYK